VEIERTISFPDIFNLTNGKTNMSTGNVSIQECLYLLINSMHPELLGDPLYGSNILENAYDYNGKLLQELVKSKISTAIAQYESRVTISLNDIEVISDDNSVIINLRYYIKSTGTYDTLSMILNLEESEEE
jgi:phage baseplate assembly protein W